ncbi:ShET2/EspL2 family type III secretion system effector toxin [uncultured Endozoicomonas sp.]|uniref:ShET2/EspL2 family type III secretion system effector toxin n=1 Tax=uncultured Endozoicomonas sp. TaxID=432652 RepID=UPI002628548C|nr:ShET2/EspL2 family type III secretion system effector toxin [uncultured Endozoicomonas sp.]
MDGSNRSGLIVHGQRNTPLHQGGSVQNEKSSKSWKGRFASVLKSCVRLIPRMVKSIGKQIASRKITRHEPSLSVKAATSTVANKTLQTPKMHGVSHQQKNSLTVEDHIAAMHGKRCSIQSTPTAEVAPESSIFKDEGCEDIEEDNPLGIRPGNRPSPEMMHDLLSSGAFETKKGIDGLRKTLDTLNDDDAFSLLGSKNSKGESILFAALVGNKGNTAQLVIDLILQSHATKAEKLELLSARNSEGAPALFVALDAGCLDSVDAFVDGILNSSLTRGSKHNLLAAKYNDEGPSGLFVAMLNEQVDCVQQYMQRVLASPALTEGAKQSLFSAQSRGGTPGLNRALRDGNDEVVDLYIKQILGSPLSNDAKVLLLKSENEAADSGLFWAMAKGNEKVTQCFVERVLKDDALTDEDKGKLLSAESGDGTSGLYHAMNQHHSGVAKLFTECIRSSDLDEDIQDDLLQASSSEFLDVDSFPNEQSAKNVSLIAQKLEQLQSERREYEQNTLFNDDAGSIDSGFVDDEENESEPKILSYMSRGRRRNLNGKAVREDSGEKIWCRHLALAFARGVFGTKESNKYYDINTLDKIARHSGIPNDAKYLSSFEHRQPKEGYYFDTQRLGESIKKALINNQEDSEKARYVLVSNSHAMGLGVKRYPDRPEIKLSFYDPNDTLRVQHLIVPSLEALGNVSLNDLLDDRSIDIYFEEDGFSGALLAPFAGKESENAIAYVDTKFTPGLLNNLLSFGHLGIGNIAERLKDHINHLDRKGAIALLSASISPDERGLGKACEHGHCLSVRSYLDVVLASSLSFADKQQVLGNQFLRDAMERWGADVTRALTEGILESNLSVGEKIDLLEAKNVTNTPSLFSGLRHGKEEPIGVYIRVILESNLPINAKERLVAGNGSTKSGLYAAFRDDNPESINAYTNAILSSKQLDGKAVIRLLTPRAFEKESGLVLAIQQDNIDSVDAFVRQVLGSERSQHTKERLLSITDHLQDDQSLYSSPAYRRYSSAIESSELKESRKQRLLE